MVLAQGDGVTIKNVSNYGQLILPDKTAPGWELLPYITILFFTLPRFYPIIGNL